MNDVQISEETLKKIAAFFLKTSIPRILEENKKPTHGNELAN
jgi:hypothetical protein